MIQYNHRQILQEEIVIEYDTDSIEGNRALADIANTKLHKDNISTSLWYSGNKSYHLHFFVDTKNVKYLSILKNTILLYYGFNQYKDRDYLPDLRMAGVHNIRLELGRHEKTGNIKTLIQEDKDYPRICKLKSDVWETYISDVRKYLSSLVESRGVDLSSNPIIKKLLDSSSFKENDDGRERTLFVLIHSLKKKYSQDDLYKLLTEWYRYSGGIKLSEKDIERKISYHWNRNYIITNHYLENLLLEIGIK